MSNFYPSSVSYLTYCVTTNGIKVWLCNLPEFFSRFSNAISSRIIKEKPGFFLKKKKQVSVKILTRSGLFFLVFHFFYFKSYFIDLK